MTHRCEAVSWRLVPFEGVESLKREIDSRLKDGSLDPVLHKEYFVSTFKIPEGMPRPKSVAVAASPQPSLRLTFRKGGESIKAIVPPTYFDAAETDSLVVEELKKAFGGKHRFVRAYLPLKLLASRAGLACYGRNNVAYVPGWGSYCRLTAFYSDVEPGEHILQEPKILPDCAGCRLCIDACPTGAISDGSFMVKAELCLTYLNEKPAEVPFPGWVAPSWHNAIVGCMICQRVCPANREVMGWVEDRGDFSEDETEYLLRGDFSDKERAGKLEEKLKRAGLDASGFPRNLEALLRG
jgi:epoxyqueuosine reductase